MPNVDIVARLKLAGEQFSAEFGQRMDRIETEARSAASRVNTALGGIGNTLAGFAAGIGIAGIAEAGKAVLDYADDLGTAADQAGVAVERYQTLKEGLRSLEIPTEKTDKVLKGLNDTLGAVQSGTENGATKALDRLGITADILAGKISDPAQLLDALAAASKGAGSEAQYASDLVDIFGKKIGVDLAAALKDGGAALHDAEQAFRDTGSVITSEMIDKLADANETIDAFVSRSRNQFVIFAANGISAFESVELRLAKLGRALANFSPIGNPSSYEAEIRDIERRTATKSAYDAQRARTVAALQEKDRIAAGDGVFKNTALPQAVNTYKRELAELRRIAKDFNANRAAAGVDDGAGAVIKPAETARTETNLRKVQAAAKEASSSLNFVPPILKDIAIQSDAAGEAARRFYDSVGVDPFDFSKKIAANDAEWKKSFDAQQEAMEESWRRQEDNVRSLADFYADAFEGGSGSIWKSFKRQGLAVISEIAARYTLALLSGKSTDFGSILSSAQGTGSPLGSILGLLNSGGGVTKGGTTIPTTGTVISEAGAVPGATSGGGILGKIGISSGTASSIGQAAGAFGAAIAVNQIVGDVFGFKGGPLGILTGLFTKTKKAAATFGTTADGFGVTGVTGNSAKFKAAASSAGDNVSSILQNIADQLGGTLTGPASGSIGVRHGDFRYDPSGRGITKKAKGAIDFDDDQEAAIKYAVSDLLKDGLLQGVSEASKRLLTNGGDLDAQLQKAVTLESIPKLLKARLDPVGAAVDTVTEKFAGMVKILDESGASAEHRADAEKLYRLELEDARKSAGDAAESLKAFLDGMKTGSDSPYSLRDQETAARAALDPYLADINAGVSIDQQKYLAAAQSFLDVERELYGSTQAYFDALNTVQAATGKAIATIGNATPITGAAAVDPFAKATAAAAEKTATATSTATDLLDQMSGQLGDLPAIRTALEAIVARGGTALSGLGAARGYV